MNASRFKTKNDEIAGLFDSIAGHYDFLNHFLSFGIDKLWRKKIIRMISKEHPDSILDIATGTSDLAIAAATKIQGVQITGIDISEKMLGIAKEKIREKHLEDRITLQKKSAESMDFADNNSDINGGNPTAQIVAVCLCKPLLSEYIREIFSVRETDSTSVKISVGIAVA